MIWGWILYGGRITDTRRKMLTENRRRPMCIDNKKKQNVEFQESLSISENSDKESIEEFKKIIFINTILGIYEEVYKEQYINVDADCFDNFYPSSFFELKLLQDTFSEANVIEHLDDILENKMTYIYVVHNIPEKRRFLIEIENNNIISHIYTENHKELSIVEEDYIQRFAEMNSVKVNRDENGN